MTAIELYNELLLKFKVTTDYKVGFNTEVSPDVRDIILHLKGNLNTEDFLPNYPTALTITLHIKKEGVHFDSAGWGDGTPFELAGSFHQDSKTYLEAFDNNAFREFAESKIALISE